MASVLALAGAGAATGASPAMAANQYGAIAINPQTFDRGFASNYSTLAGAQRRARRECGEGCEDLAWVRNGCISLAVSSSGKVYKGVARTRSAAKRKLNRVRPEASRVIGTVCA